MSLHISQVAQIGLTVSDMTAAKHFYADILGLPVLMQMDDMMFCDAHNTRLMIGTQNEGAKPGSEGAILYLHVNDIQASYQHLNSHNVSIIRPPFIAHKDDVAEMWLCFFEDPDKNRFALVTHRDA